MNSAVMLPFFGASGLTWDVASTSPHSSAGTPGITHLTTQFTSSKSTHNSVSRVHFLHNQLGLTPEVLDSFLVTSLLRVADLTSP